MPDCEPVQEPAVITVALTSEEKKAEGYGASVMVYKITVGNLLARIVYKPCSGSKWKIEGMWCEYDTLTQAEQACLRVERPSKQDDAKSSRQLINDRQVLQVAARILKRRGNMHASRTVQAELKKL